MMNSVKKVSILGCGWLGLPLAGHLLSQHISVNGSYRSLDTKLELLRWGIKPFHVDVNEPDQINSSFFHCNVLVIALPPTKAGGENYASNIHKILLKALAAGVQAVYFMSSTSVYAPQNEVTTELNYTLNLAQNGPTLLAAESYVRELFPENHLIARLGGLIGPGRNPGRFLAGKKNIPGADVPVNFLGLEDGSRILSELICNHKLGYTFNLVNPEHPTKKEYYDFACALFGHEQPTFSDEEKNKDYKLVDGNLLVELTGIEYLIDNWKLYLHSLDRKTSNKVI